MKRVLVITNNLQQASYRLRIDQLVPLLREREIDWRVDVRPRGILARRRMLAAAGEFDAVVLQRKLLDPGDMRVLRNAARRLIFDLDDAVMLEQTRRGPIHRWRLARRFAAVADSVDHVVAGNDYLADFFRKRGRRDDTITILPTVVDPAHYTVKQHAPTDRPTLVWIGSRSTLPYLREHLPFVEAAARRVAGLRLRIIADASVESTESLVVEFVPWSRAGEAAALGEADVGIAPTPSDPWTLGKCGFKIVQYMASGLPAIASPVGANATLVTADTTGLHAVTGEQWTEAIVRLAGDAALRASMGAAGRARVERDLNLGYAADTWARLLA